MKVQELAQVISERFDKVDQRFDRMDQRFGKIDQRFDRMDQRFGKIDQRFDRMDQRFGKIDQRLDLSNSFVGVELGEIKQKLHGVQATVNDIYERLDASAKADETYLHEMTALGSQVSRHERWIGDLAGQARIVLES